MNKKTRFILAGLCAVMMYGITGCQSNNVDEKKKDEKHEYAGIDKKELAAAEKAAKAYAADYFKALKDGNYDLYVKGRAPEAREKMSRQKFEKFIAMHKEHKWEMLGEPKYLGQMDKGLIRVYLWVIKVQVELKNPKSKKMNTLRQDILYSMSLGKLNGKYIVGYFGPQG